MIKIFKKCNIFSKIALIVSIISMIVAISNIFVQSETMRLIVWCLVILVLVFDCWSTIKENLKILENNAVLSGAYFRALAAFRHIEIEIEYMDLPEEAKEQLKDFIESECEKVKVIREGAEHEICKEMKKLHEELTKVENDEHN